MVHSSWSLGQSLGTCWKYYAMHHMQHEVRPKSNTNHELCIHEKNGNIFPKHGLCIHRQLVAATHGPLPSKVWGSQLHAQLVAPCFLIPFTCHLKFPCPAQRYKHDQPKQSQPPPADQICLDSIFPHDLLHAGC